MSDLVELGRSLGISDDKMMQDLIRKLTDVLDVKAIFAKHRPVDNGTEGESKMCVICISTTKTAFFPSPWPCDAVQAALVVQQLRLDVKAANEHFHRWETR